MENKISSGIDDNAEPAEQCSPQPEEDEDEDAFEEFFGTANRSRSESGSSVDLTESLMRDAGSFDFRTQTTVCKEEVEADADLPLCGGGADAIDEEEKSFASLIDEMDKMGPLPVPQTEDKKVFKPGAKKEVASRSSAEDDEIEGGKKYFKDTPMDAEQTWDFSLQALLPNYKSKCLWLEGSAYKQFLGECLHEMHNVYCPCKENKKVSICRICHTVFCSTKCFKRALKIATNQAVSDDEDDDEVIEAAPLEVKSEPDVIIKKEVQKLPTSVETISESDNAKYFSRSNNLPMKPIPKNAPECQDKRTHSANTSPPKMENSIQNRDGVGLNKSKGVGENSAPHNPAGTRLPPKSLWPTQVATSHMPVRSINTYSLPFTGLQVMPFAGHMPGNSSNVPPPWPIRAQPPMLPSGLQTNLHGVDPKTLVHPHPFNTGLIVEHGFTPANQNATAGEMINQLHHSPGKVLRNPGPRGDSSDQQYQLQLENDRQSTSGSRLENAYSTAQKYDNGSRAGFESHKTSPPRVGSCNKKLDVAPTGTFRDEICFRPQLSMSSAVLSHGSHFESGGQGMQTRDRSRQQNVNVNDWPYDDKGPLKSSGNISERNINAQSTNSVRNKLPSYSSTYRDASSSSDTPSDQPSGRNYTSHNNFRQKKGHAYHHSSSVSQMNSSRSNSESGSTRIVSNSNRNTFPGSSSKYGASSGGQSPSRTLHTGHSRLGDSREAKRKEANLHKNSRHSNYVDASGRGTVVANPRRLSLSDSSKKIEKRILQSPDIPYGVRMPVKYLAGKGFSDFSVISLKDLDAFQLLHPLLQECEKNPMAVFEVDDYCMVNFAFSEAGKVEKKEWYRGIITKVIGKVGVYFLDLGIDTVVNVAEIYELPVAFKNSRPLAIRVRCFSVKDDIPESEELQENFDKLVRQAVVKLRVTHMFNTERYKYAGYLDVLYMNKWFDCGVLLKRFQIAEPNAEVDVQRQVQQGLIRSMITFDSLVEMQKFSRLPATLPQATLISVKNLNEFYITTPEMTARRGQIERQLNDRGFASNAKPVVSLTDLTFPAFMVIDISTKLWVRVKVTEVVVNAGCNSAVVQKLDYGDSFTIPITELRQLPTNMLVPGTVYLCSLPVEVLGRKQLTTDDEPVRYLNELCDNSVSLKVTAFLTDLKGTNIIELCLEGVRYGCAYSFLQKGWVKKIHDVDLENCG